MRPTLALATVAAAGFAASSPATAEEGMWTYDGVPPEAIRKAYS